MTISYELLKEAKDAGFPQELDGQWMDEDGSVWNQPTSSSCFCVPTLDEVIEACGVEYIVDGEAYQFHLLYSEGSWFAQYDNSDFSLPNPSKQGKGPVPLEAVLRLYIALNKK
jgi:hypothetical protein